MRTFAEPIAQHIGEFGADWKDDMKKALSMIHQKAGGDREQKSMWTLHGSSKPTEPWKFTLKAKVSELHICEVILSSPISDAVAAQRAADPGAVCRARPSARLMPDGVPLLRPHQVAHAEG